MFWLFLKMKSKYLYNQTIMWYKKFKVFNGSNRLKVLKYSLGSRLINSVPKGLINTYEFIRLLNAKDVFFDRKGGLIQFSYPIEDKNYTFFIDENSSDADVFRQIIIDEEYNEVRTLISKFNIDIRHIVDGGANVGFTSIYLSHF